MANGVNESPNESARAFVGDILVTVWVDPGGYLGFRPGLKGREGLVQHVADNALRLSWLTVLEHVFEDVAVDLEPAATRVSLVVGAGVGDAKPVDVVGVSGTFEERSAMFGELHEECC